MADNQLDILIRILTQEVGSEKAKDILKKTTEEAKKLERANVDLSRTFKELDANVSGSKESINKVTVAKKELLAAARGLTAQFPIAGRALALFSNPIAATTAVLAVTVGLFVKLRNEAAALAAEIDFKPTAEGLSGVADAASLASDQFDKLAGKTAELNRIREGFDRQHKNAIEIINAEAKAAEELAEQLGLVDEASKKARGEETRAKLEEAERENILRMQRELNILIDERAKAEIELIGAEKQGLETTNKLEDVNRNIAALKEKQVKVGLLRPDENKALLDLFGIRSEAELNAADAQARLGTARSFAGDVRGRVSAAEGRIGSARSALASGDLVREATTQAGERTAAVGSAVGSFFQSGGRLMGAGGSTPTNMLAQFQSAVAELAASRMETSQLLMILTNIFKDGVVSRQELDALQKAVANQRRN